MGRSGVGSTHTPLPLPKGEVSCGPWRWSDVVKGFELNGTICGASVPHALGIAQGAVVLRCIEVGISP